MARSEVGKSLSLLLLAALSYLGFRSSEPSAVAGTAPSLTLEEVVDRASSALEGVVLAREARTGPDGIVETVYRLAVARRFIGSGGGEEEVVLPGGVLDDGSGLIVAGVPELEVGESVLLFLSERVQGTDRRMTVGLEQGRYRLVEGTDGRRVAIGAGSVFARSTDGSQHGGPEAYDYATLRARIEAELQRRGTEEGK
ncbi:MAG: hypothetical protein R3F34_13640 [Planctomycetota bacterium]